MLDRDGVIISVNSAWRETFAALQTGGESFGVQTPYETVCGRIIPDIEASALRQAIRELLAGKVRSLTHAYVVVSSGQPRWRQIRVSPLQAGVAHFIAVHEDLTEVGQARAALRRTREQLRGAQQDERRRIVMELHGSTGEYLTEMGLGVARLRRLMSDNTGAQDILDDVVVSLKEAAKEIRVMSNLMKPDSLHRHGLEAAARGFVDGFAARTGLKMVFRSEGPVDKASDHVQHAAFRVIQEALSNVHRHAHADGVEVELASRDDLLTLRIADDGRGIASLRQAYPEGVPPGVGIPGMRSRVEHLGGSMNVASDRAGTVVVAWMPLVRALGAGGGHRDGMADLI
ncbi:MAG TPA: ATP-binding protein [Chloroflexota bacterium]